LEKVHLKKSYINIFGAKLNIILKKTKVLEIKKCYCT
jgi:hypothetical protein